MAVDRQRRIQELAVQEYVRRSLPSFLHCLSIAFEREVARDSLLPQEVGARLRSAMQQHIEPGFTHPFPINHASYASDEIGDFLEAFDSLSKRFTDEPVALFLSSFDECPLVWTNAREVNEHLQTVLEIGDTIAICTGDCRMGICASWNKGDAKEEYEIVRWD